MIFQTCSWGDKPWDFRKEAEKARKDLPGPSMVSEQGRSYTVNEAGTEGFTLLEQQFQRDCGYIRRDRVNGGALKMGDNFVASYFTFFFDKILD